jgi:hypothetical protein
MISGKTRENLNGSVGPDDLGVVDAVMSTETEVKA